MTFKPLTNSGFPSGSSPSWSSNPTNSYPSSFSSTSTWTPPHREWAVSYPTSNSNTPSYSSIPLPSNSMNSYQSSFSSGSTWTPPNREWSVSYPAPNSNTPSYSSIPRPSNPMNSYSSSLSSTSTWTPSNREWTTPHVASYPNYSQLGTQANLSPLSSSTLPYSSSLTRDFSTNFPSQNSNLSGNALSNAFQFSSLTTPHFSPKDSFSFNDFSSLRKSPSNERFEQITSFNWNRLESFREQNLKISPPPVLWTMEDRCFQSFKDAMKLDAPFEAFLTTMSPRPFIDSKPLTTDVSSLAKFHNEAPHISTAKVTVIDAGIGIWNGAKRAFALIGLEQMEVSGQERIEILDTMTETDQASRTTFKEKLLSPNSSELHPVSVAKNYARLFISKQIHDTFHDYSSRFVELSKYRADLTPEGISSQNFWDAPRENGHAAIDKFCRTNCAQKYLSGSQFPLIAKLEIPFLSSGSLGTISKVVSVSEKALLPCLNHSLIIKSEQMIGYLEKRISGWLGEGTQFIRNKASDSVFLSKDGLRKVRFDFKRPHPHESPHAHFERLVNGEWKEINRIYPIDVPHK